MSDNLIPQRSQHLGREEVDHLVGHLEDATIAVILATGATYEEIEQALKWTGGGAEDPHLNAHGLTPTAELVCDILLSDPAFDPEEDRDAIRD